MNQTIINRLGAKHDYNSFFVLLVNQITVNGNEMSA